MRFRCLVGHEQNQRSRYGSHIVGAGGLLMRPCDRGVYASCGAAAVAGLLPAVIEFDHPLNSLVVDVPAFDSQQLGDFTITVPPILFGEPDQRRRRASSSRLGFGLYCCDERAMPTVLQVRRSDVSSL